MLQWVEIFHAINTVENNDRAYYTYSKTWTETPMDSSYFRNTGFENPSVYSWPYRSNSAQAQRVNLGEYSLDSNQVSRLGVKRKTKVNWSAEDHTVLYNASQNFLNSGFSELTPKGHYIVSSYQNNMND